MKKEVKYLRDCHPPPPSNGWYKLYSLIKSFLQQILEADNISEGCECVLVITVWVL